MSDERAHELEERGIEAAKSGQKDEARKLLQHALRLDPVRDNAWLWLASVAKDKRERLLCLQKVLEINPENELGIKAVQAMGIDPAQLLPKRQTIEHSLVSEDESASDELPMPPADFVRNAIEQAKETVQPYLDLPETNRITWNKKSKGRAGEQEIWILRTQIGTAVAVFGAIVLTLLMAVINSNPQVQLVLFGASPTPRPPSATPTSTLTPRPDINPTATPTINFTVEPTFTPTPTMNVLATRWPLDRNNNPLYATPQPTDIYLGSRGNAVATAIVALNTESDYQTSIQRLESEQASGGARFEPHPYYFEALLHIRLGDYNQALATLDDAQYILDDVSENAVVGAAEARNLQPMINAGYMQVYLQQIRNAQTRNQTVRINELIELMEEQFTEAYEIDPSYGEPVLLMTEAYLIRRRFDDAIEITERAVNERLASEPLVVTAYGNSYLQRGYERARIGQHNQAREDFAYAQYIGYYGTQLNPFSEPPHQLRIQASLALDQVALASAYANEFLFYRPDSAIAYRLLAAVRAAENKPEFALDIFSQALEQENISSNVLAGIYVERAQLYEEQRRYDLARYDYDQALNLYETPETRHQRMLVAYYAGDLDTARKDAELLLEEDIIGQYDARLIRARLIVDANQTDLFDQALQDLNTILGESTGNIVPVIHEYQARIYFHRGDLPEALTAINRSLNAVETGSRRYLRGMIYEARGERDNAIADYRWIGQWDRVFGYPFTDDALTRLDQLLSGILEEQMQATATSVSATQAVFDVTATYEAELALTASPTPTPTATDEFALQGVPDEEVEGEAGDS
jgi:tetratricopeptide (TPR) repeat protein